MTMDLKSVLKKEAEKALLKQAAGKILPMESEPKPVLGWKAKLAGALAIIGAVATALAQYLAG
jgi:hypothetical protein